VAIRSVAMRKQYYFRPSDRGYRAWDVDRLVALTKDFPRIQIALSDIRELDEAFPADEKGVVTWRNVVGHMALIEAAGPSYPIILAANGQVMDGRHRIAKATLGGKTTIEAASSRMIPSLITLMFIRTNCLMRRKHSTALLSVRR
jgi:hypothetical protein